MPDNEKLLTWFREYRDLCRWQTAKSGPPHQYTIKGWRPDREREFIQAVKIIRALGKPERFWKQTFIYLYIDGLKYWTMGAPVNETTVLNRAEDQTFYGQL